MTWEFRPHRRPVYTRSLRANGRRIRQYFGSGPAAEAAAEEDARRRAEREAEAERVHNNQAQHEPLDELLDRLAVALDLLTKATLIAAGFHRPARKPWRRRREHVA
jgi:hypothetical protein